MLGLAIYALVVAVIGAAAPQSWWDPQSSGYLLAFGVVALWRYGWGMTHFVRFLIYTKLVFPGLRRRADTLGGDGMPGHVYLLLTSFRIDTETTLGVYRAAIQEAIDCGVPTTLVCSVVEMCDQRLIKHLFHAMAPPDRVQLSFIRIAGTGKRDALAQGFRMISMMRPKQDDVVAVIDGDTVLEEGLLLKTLPFFKMLPKMDALTTDEICAVAGPDVFRDWYSLRFAQRQIHMSSIALSKRVLTLTGRMSAFRASVVVRPDFIAMMERDSVDHWRLGRFQFLTGDDKTSWYYVITSGREMLYVPDARILTLETPPDPNFFRTSTTLMIRWFGNMLRTNGRAAAVGPKRIGLFVWWAILDQRVSMWTSLIGPTGAILLTIFVTPMAAFIYIYWIAITRLMQTLSLFAARRDVSWRYPFLLYFNQIYGSLLKTFVVFRLDRQKWTRQKTQAVRDLGNLRARLIKASSFSMHAVTVSLFVVLVAYIVGVFDASLDDLALLLL